MSTGVTHFSRVDLWGQWFVGGQCQGCGPVGGIFADRQRDRWWFIWFALHQVVA